MEKDIRAKIGATKKSISGERQSDGNFRDS